MPQERLDSKVSSDNHSNNGGRWRLWRKVWNVERRLVVLRWALRYHFNIIGRLSLGVRGSTDYDLENVYVSKSTSTSASIRDRHKKKVKVTTRFLLENIFLLMLLDTTDGTCLVPSSPPILPNSPKKETKKKETALINLNKNLLPLQWQHRGGQSIAKHRLDTPHYNQLHTWNHNTLRDH